MTTALRGGLHIRVTGVVQGVGFRPFVHRLAGELSLHGIVGNDAGSVFIEVSGPTSALDVFVSRLRRDAPPLAIIDSLEVTGVTPADGSGFEIVESRSSPGAVTTVAPDTAVCDACLGEMWDPADRRYLHPFITCTDCGPRFTITRTLPYDRPGTTMAGFAMCPACRVEYHDPADRRYHAQPIGCHGCGPRLTFRLGDGPVLERLDALRGARTALRAGAIVAVKGLGGYHLVCDAASHEAVALLRRRKGRAHKPFAVMTPDLAAAQRVASLGVDEIELLVSPARPIVLAAARPHNGLCDQVAPANPLIGVMLPYTPLHHLLFRGPDQNAPGSVLGPLVMTSSNPSGEPICYHDDEVAERLGHLLDGVLAHDRPIHVPCDDSVVRIADRRLSPIRRSRGYAPLPVWIPARPCHVLAVGAEFKNAFCVGRGGRAWMSQHIGDMGNLATLEAFEVSVRQFCDLYRITPTVVAIDAHPGYLSGRWARQRYPDLVVEVQHHHAHVAAVMAEHRLDPDTDVIGIAFDGTGYGDDGTIWGGEVLEANALRYRRVGHLSTVALPGGDAAIRHPWRIALAHLRAAGIAWADDLAPVSQASDQERKVLDRQLATNLACVPTTSMGRLFDAVSSLLGLRHNITYEAQAAIELEQTARGAAGGPWRLAFATDPAGVRDPGPVLRGLIAGLRAGIDVGRLAAMFHRAVADMVVTAACDRRTRTGCQTVVLAGGVWQNGLLQGLARQGLSDAGFATYSNQLVPPNDGGLALGQLFIAGRRAPLRGGRPKS